jgi:ATP-dependent Clp protease protease subunit
MIHQPHGGAQGQSVDIEIATRQYVQLRNELYEIISRHSGRPFKQIEKDADRDYWLKAGEAQEYGLIDEVLVR